MWQVRMSQPLTLGSNPKTKGIISANGFGSIINYITNIPREIFRMVETLNSVGYEKIPPAPYIFQNMTHLKAAKGCIRIHL